MYETLRDMANVTSSIMQELDGDKVGGSGTSGYLPNWSDSGSSLADSPAYTDGSGIGIGTEAPGSPLDILDDGVGCLRLSGSSSGFVGLRPAAAAGSVTYTMPSADGSGGDALVTNGAGTLSWTTITGGGGGFPYVDLGLITEAVTTSVDLGGL
jgi:hypothetical protein